MSFSQEVREELARLPLEGRHCMIAELAAIVGQCGHISVSADRVSLVLSTDSELLAGRGFRLIEGAFHIRPQCRVQWDVSHQRVHHCQVMVTDSETAVQILQALKLEPVAGAADSGGAPVSGMLLQHACCKRACLRGAFLAAGTISDPEKSYHFELICSGRKRAVQLQELMEAFSITAKIVRRKNHYVVYIKEGRLIADMLTVMQATVSLLNFENYRIVREIKGNINRRVNCETANISKTVSAAVGQINDINLICDRQGLESLPEQLQEAARLRLQYPHAPLHELGRYMDPPVGKSGVNHRLRKLKQIADRIRENEEDYYVIKNR